MAYGIFFSGQRRLCSDSGDQVKPYSFVKTKDTKIFLTKSYVLYNYMYNYIVLLYFVKTKLGGMCFLFDLSIFLLRQAMLTHIQILYTILRPFVSGHFFEMGLTYQRVDVVQYSTLYYPKDFFQQSL